MKASEAAVLFDANVESYDRVNRIISLGLDSRWRRWAVDQALSNGAEDVLDAMAGAGEIAVAAAVRGAHVTAVDVSPRMLESARCAADRAGVSVRTRCADLTAADALVPRGFDAAVLSFGLRYVDQKEPFLRSLAGSLRPGGRLIILEFCTPPRRLISRLAAVYFFRVLPGIAARLGEGPELYRVLASSTKEIGSLDAIAGIAEKAGLTVLERKRMGFGLVAGIVLTPGG